MLEANSFFLKVNIYLNLSILVFLLFWLKCFGDKRDSGTAVKKQRLKNNFYFHGMLRWQFSDTPEPNFLKLVGVTAKYTVYIRNYVIYIFVK